MLSTSLQAPTSETRLGHTSGASGQRLFLQGSTKGIRVASTLHKIGQWFCSKFGGKERYVIQLEIAGVGKVEVNANSFKKHLATHDVARAYFNNIRICQETQEGAPTPVTFQIQAPDLAAANVAYEAFKDKAREMNGDESPVSKGVALLAITAGLDAHSRAYPSTEALQSTLRPVLPEHNIHNPTANIIFQAPAGRNWERKASNFAYERSAAWKNLYQHVLTAASQTRPSKPATSRPATPSARLSAEVITPEADKLTQDEPAGNFSNLAKHVAIATVAGAVGLAVAGIPGLFGAGLVYLGSKAYSSLQSTS